MIHGVVDQSATGGQSGVTAEKIGRSGQFRRSRERVVPNAPGPAPQTIIRPSRRNHGSRTIYADASGCLYRNQI